MRSLLHAHSVQLHAGRQPPGEPLPDVLRERFPGREPRAVGELGDGLVDVASIEAGGDLLGEERVERDQAHHAAGLGRERPLHRHAALVAVPVIHRGLAKL